MSALPFARLPWRDRALIGLFTFSICVAWIVALPPWEGPDEPAHYAYVERLSHGAFPPTEAGPQRFSAALGTSVVRSLESFRTRQDRPLTETSERVIIRPEPGGLSTVGRTAITATTYPPLYYVLMLPFYEVGGDRAVERLYAMRVGSAVIASVFAVLTALLIYDATRNRRLALAGGMLAALPPMMSQTGAVVSPDVLLCAATAWAILAIRRVREHRTTGRIVSVLLAFAAIAITKPVGPAIVVALLAAFFGWGLLQRARGHLVPAIVTAVVALPPLTYVAWKLYSPPEIAQHPLASVRLGFSYLWQFYLPRLGFMDPIFTNSVLTQPVPVWGTFVRTGVGYFGWISAPMPEWSYVVVAIGTTAALAVPIVAGGIRRMGRQTLECLTFVLLILLILHLSEFSVYSSSGATILQGRYLLPTIPAALLVFLGPLSRLSARTQTVGIATAVATWCLAAGVGLAAALSFFAA